MAADHHRLAGMIAARLALLLALQRPAPAAEAVDCGPTDEAPCVVQAPRLLPAPALARTLPSGTRVALLPFPAAGRVALELRVLPPGGVRTEDLVVAWLLARHQGGPAAAERRLARARLGGVESVVAVPGGFAVRVEGPSAALPELLALEARRLHELRPSDDEVARALAGVVTERLGELSRPDAQVVELVRPRPDLGAPPSGDMVRARIQQAWGGAAAVLVIAGDVDGATLDGPLDAAFGELPPLLDAAPLPPAALLPAVEQAWSDSAAAPRVVVAWQGPTTAPGSPEHAVRSVLAELLVAPGSPLAARLVDSGLATRLWSPPVPDGVVVAAELAPQVHPGAAFAAVEAAADELLGVANGELEARMEAARVHLARRAMLGLRRPADWAAAVAEVLAAGAPPESVDQSVDQLRQVQPEALRQAAVALLRAENRREAVLAASPGAGQGAP